MQTVALFTGHKLPTSPHLRWGHYFYTLPLLILKLHVCDPRLIEKVALYLYLCNTEWTQAVFIIPWISGVARFQRLLGHLVGMATCYHRVNLDPQLWDSVARTWCSYLLLKLTGKEAKNWHCQLYSTWQCCCSSGKLTSHNSPGHSEIYRGLGPYGPGCSYATAWD